ncbi:MAG: YigZ family protein [Christensenellaceae bacterium]|jgi:uncharacterized YigZ family protein|nr:YigZ family protein [Christensenellaceae bacterium]
MQGAAYKTVLCQNSGAFVVNKSRFIGSAAPVSSEEEALAFLRKVRALNKDASHNCYAYIIGQNAGIQRYSDDGEPSGTAGLPIIELIKARAVVDVCVVVTRYFGGVLLGAGGLIRAYAQGAKTALDAAKVITMHRSRRYLFECDYAFAGRLDHWLRDQPVRLNEKAFGAAVSYDVHIKAMDAPAFCAGLGELSAGRCEALLVDEGYQGWEEE